ncbi:MAG: hypothetical protein Q8M67_03675, partial [Bacteroidota bacterium]|nr:hypothetical protein [Bacteroidota bacterium]
IKTPGAEVLAFNKNLATVAEWFHQNVPMLTNPKGFDLNAWAYGQWDDYYKLKKSSYSLRAEIDFGFQLFYSKGGKWIIEPPHYSFDINDTETGHGTNPNYNYFSVSEHDPFSVKNISPAQKKAINDAVDQLNGIFAVFPFSKELTPGVHVYKESVNGYSSHIIVFNPERPPYWIPLTLKELAEIHLDYYTSQKDEFLLPQLKKEIAELSEEELNAPAYSGHDTHFVLKANGKEEGLQLMRFNPDYWDKSLPPSAIQFMTFGYLKMSQEETEERFKNNGHPNYPSLLMNSFNLEELAGLIKRRK